MVPVVVYMLGRNLVHLMVQVYMLGLDGSVGLFGGVRGSYEDPTVASSQPQVHFCGRSHDSCLQLLRVSS